MNNKGGFLAALFFVAAMFGDKYNELARLVRTLVSVWLAR